MKSAQRTGAACGGGLSPIFRIIGAGRRRMRLCLFWGALQCLPAAAAPTFWLDWEGNLLAPPRVVAKWNLVEIEGVVSEDYTGFEVEALIGSLYATANYQPTYPVTSGGNTYYLWSNSGNWDSLWVDVLHAKRVYDYLSDPEGLIWETPAILYGEENTLSEMAIAGPTESNVSIGLEDLPFMPDDVDASVGTTIRFDVNIDRPETLVLDQNAEILHLHIGPNGYLRNPSNLYLNAARGLDNAGRIEGAIRAWGGVVNLGTISSDYFLLAGGLRNEGTVSGSGAIQGPVTNNGILRARGPGEVLMDTPSIAGSGQLLCLEGSALKIWNSAGPRPFLGQNVDSDGQLTFEEGWTPGPGVEVHVRGYLFGQVTGETIVKPGSLLHLWADVGEGGRLDVAGEGTVVWQGFSIRPGGVVDVRDGARWYTVAPWMIFQGNEGELRIANGSRLILSGQTGPDRSN